MAQQQTQQTTEIHRICLDIELRMQNLKQAHVRNFVAYTYMEGSPQELQQAHNAPFQPAVHYDEHKWMQAKESNPRPDVCYALPLYGLQALEQHASRQQALIQAEQKMLDDLGNSFQNLKSVVMTQSMTKLDECKQRHLQLQRQLVSVMAQIEEAGVAGGNAKRDYTREMCLDQALMELQNRINQPGQFQSRVAQVGYVLRSLLQRLEAGPLPKRPGCFDGQAFDGQGALAILDEQGNLLSKVQDELRRTTNDVAQMEAVLQKSSGGRSSAELYAGMPMLGGY